MSKDEFPGMITYIFYGITKKMVDKVTDEDRVYEELRQTKERLDRIECLILMLGNEVLSQSQSWESLKNQLYKPLYQTQATHVQNLKKEPDKGLDGNPNSDGT